MWSVWGIHGCVLDLFEEHLKSHLKWFLTVEREGTLSPLLGYFVHLLYS